MALTLGGGSNGIAFIVAYGVICEAIAKDVSSPQTAELNIQTREKTLLKWVHVGQVEGAAIIVIAAVVDKQHRNAIIAGGVLAMVVTELEYLYAKKSGLENPGPATEMHNPGFTRAVEGGAIGGATAAVVSGALT